MKPIVSKSLVHKKSYSVRHAVYYTVLLSGDLKDNKYTHMFLVNKKQCMMTWLALVVLS